MQQNFIVKSLLTVSCLLSACPLFADTANADYKNEVMPVTCAQGLLLKDGFYIGAAAGYDAYRVKLAPATTLGAFGFSGATNISSTGFVGGLYAGYGMYMNPWGYLGAEIYGNGSTASDHSTYNIGVTSLSSNLSQSVNWGISLLPGVKFSESTLVYVRLGWSTAHFTAKESFNAGILSSTANTSSWNFDFNYGVGIETAVYQNISVRGEINHTNYGTFNSSLGTKYSPTLTQVMVGVSYHFG